MKNALFCLLAVLLATSNLYSQVHTDYNSYRFKQEFQPLTPLPVDQTFSLKFPDSLTYLKSEREIRTYWNTFGLVLNNKREEKKPANYTFKMDFSGIKILKTEIEERDSKITVTEHEFLRNYTFNFPAKLQIIDNSNNQVIKTITITSDQDVFKRSYHRNFFITDSFNPNFNKIVGFDSLQTIQRVNEMNIKILKRLEGNFLSEVIFAKVIDALVHNFGKPKVKATIIVMNPKEKDRKFDFSDYDAASQKLKKAMELMGENPADPNIQTLINEAQTFYMEKNNAPDNRFQDFLPVMVHYNLAEINLLKEQPEEADKFFSMVQADQKPKLYFENIWEPPYKEYKTIVEFRKAIKSNKVFLKQQSVEVEKVSEETDEVELTKGFLVTNEGDTLHGNFKNFKETSMANHTVVFIANGKERTYLPTELKAASTEGVIYESIDYRFDGAFSGDRVPGKKLMALIYASPTLKFYAFRQVDEYIYFFPKTKEYKRYKPFSSSDALSIVTNYNKKLGEVFSNVCPSVTQKIEGGLFQLKKEDSGGHIQAITEFENACGSKQLDSYVMSKENVIKKYK